MSPPPLSLRFVMSAGSLRELPPTDAEVAFVGRSNVGKSSLLNALANRRQLANVSKTPGRTQRLNLFELRPGATLMDLPGYGFASVSATQKRTWPAMIEGYLLGRSQLQSALVLVDAEIGPTKLDLQVFEWLAHHERPYQIVATKLDKVKPSKLARRRAELSEACGVSTDDVIWVSAAKGDGIAALRGRVLMLLGQRHDPVRP